jgi:hypothetical protein
MITTSDLIQLRHTSDLTEGGIAHAMSRLPYSFDHAINYQRLRHVVANAAVQIAFCRHLSLQNIPFEVQPAPSFTDFERYDISLNNRRCELQSYLISRREQILEMQHTPEVLLNAPALVPSDTHAREGHRRDDLYLFAFLGGQVTSSQDDLKRVMDANQPHYLVYIMPSVWRRPQHWNPLGTLNLKSDSEEELLVEVHGQDGAREVTVKTISLPPKTKITVQHDFYSISALHVRRLPHARVGIHCETFKESCVIAPLEWGNLWVYARDIFLTGYMSHEEFSRTAKHLPIDSRTFQYDHTKVKNLFVPISNLRPMQDLFK